MSERASVQNVIEAFVNAMASFGPFERDPHIAVAVSGGPDSMALALLARDWVRARGGRLTALIVDHGIRAEAADEAEQVRDILAANGIAAAVLKWDGEKPKSGIQRRARDARYGLLEAWCERHHILHLLVGHHADDQAETIWMRLERGSGPDGLAGMSAVRELAACRMLRPLLSVRKTDLVEYNDAYGLNWIEDPSNADQRFGRNAARAFLRADDAVTQGLLKSAHRFARVRTYLDFEAAKWTARHVCVHAAGFAEVDADQFSKVDPAILSRVLGNLARLVGGRMYAPSPEAVERLSASLIDGKSATLSRAVFARHGGKVRVCREERNLPKKLALESYKLMHWDGRFFIENRSFDRPVIVRPYTSSLHSHKDLMRAESWLISLPPAARIGLPIIEYQDCACVPKPGRVENNGISVQFAPHHPVGGSGFFVA